MFDVVRFESRVESAELRSLSKIVQYSPGQGLWPLCETVRASGGRCALFGASNRNWAGSGVLPNARTVRSADGLIAWRPRLPADPYMPDSNDGEWPISSAGATWRSGMNPTGHVTGKSQSPAAPAGFASRTTILDHTDLGIWGMKKNNRRIRLGSLHSAAPQFNAPAKEPVGATPTAGFSRSVRDAEAMI